MNTTSNTLFVVRSSVLLVYFPLFGTEVMASIVALSWIRFDGKAQISIEKYLADQTEGGIG